MNSHDYNKDVEFVRKLQNETIINAVEHLDKGQLKKREEIHKLGHASSKWMAAN